MKKIALVVGLIFIFMLATLSGCIQQPQEETVKIGVIFPLSGNNAVYGEWGRNALEIAKDEINASSGINGRKIVLLYEDGKFNPGETLSAFRKLLDVDGIHYVITLGSSPALAVSPLANSNKVIQMDCSATTSAYRSEGDFTFRTAPKAEQFGTDAAKYLIGKGEKEASMLYINNDQGSSIYNAFSEEYAKLGGNLLMAEKFEQDGRDFRSVILKAIANDRQPVFLIGHMKESGLIIKQMNELGYKNFVLSHVYSIEGDTFLEAAGDFNNEIVYLAPDYEPEKNNLTKAYNEEYKKRFGKDSEYFGAFAYDALKALALGISKCEDPANTECVKGELFKIKGYAGLTGDISFDKFGDRIVDLSLKAVKNGKFVLYEGGSE